ncbi:MAG: hypothetical protein Q8O84_02960, partial [Nanoarchaeota archaeon]|nr:hypothetical protein [Nanoarchaeota archaeon]
KREDMDLKTEIEFSKKIFEKIMNIKTLKTKDYGGIRFYDLGLQGFTHDILRKTGRLKNLVFINKANHISDLEINFETLEDTLFDLINYSFLLLEEIEIQKGDKQ